MLCYYKLSTLTPSKIARSKGDIWGSVKNKILLKMSVIHFVAFLYWHLGKKMRRNFWDSWPCEVAAQDAAECVSLITPNCSPTMAAANGSTRSMPFACRTCRSATASGSIERRNYALAMIRWSRLLGAGAGCWAMDLQCGQRERRSAGHLLEQQLRPTRPDDTGRAVWLNSPRRVAS